MHFLLLGYIDPAGGAILLQAVVGGFLAAGIIFRRYLMAPIWFLLGKNKSKDQSDADDVTTSMGSGKSECSES